MIRDYKSVLSKQLNDFIDFKVSNGSKEKSYAYLNLFDKFLLENNYQLNYLNKEILDKWLIQNDHETKNSRNDRAKCVRQFSKYLNCLNDKSIILINNNFSVSKTIPYVFTYDEIVLFFNQLDNYCKELKNANKIILPVYLRLLYTCGFRNGELVKIKKENVDLVNKNILVLDSKNNKDRLVYFSDDVSSLLTKYISFIEKQLNNEWLFPSCYGNEGKHICQTSINKLFNIICDKANIGNNNHKPVPHSLRHTYVVHRFDSWIKEGKDANKLMPYMSKQLGHKSIKETFYYYHMLINSFDAIKNKDRDLYPEVMIYEE